MEKIHGTSAHITWKDGKITYFSGGGKHEEFVKLFDENNLIENFEKLGHDDVIIYGEYYGGKMNKQAYRYGTEMKFIVFEVRIGGKWLNVPNAEEITKNFGLEFVHYVKVPVTLETLDAERDAPSVQAIRNGIGDGTLPREGIVIRPLIEVIKNNGGRIIVKHKREEEQETKTKREVSPERMEILREATEIAEEWVTENRLTNILSHYGNDIDKKDIQSLIQLMIADVEKESVGEIEEITPEVRKAIGRKSAELIKGRLEENLAKKVRK
jgi:hypothetical protein